MAILGFRDLVLCDRPLVKVWPQQGFTGLPFSAAAFLHPQIPVRRKAFCNSPALEQNTTNHLSTLRTGGNLDQECGSIVLYQMG